MGKRKEYTGTVLSRKMLKTIVVRITQTKKDPRYSKIVKTYAKFKVHDEKNTAQVNDIVRIRETRPISKDKRFMLIAVVKKAETAQIEIKEEAA